MSEPRIIHGDCRTVLPTLEAGSVQCCVAGTLQEATDHG